MDKWILTGPKTLTKEPQTEMSVNDDEVKVKVTHLLVSNYDALTYSGELPVRYPKIPGRFAVGVVTDAGSKVYGMEKGSRVYLKAARPCRKCLQCRSGNTADCENALIAGRDFDGFMRDFVVCDYKDVDPLPDSVDNMHALCIESVALAENIYDKLELSAGSKVAIIGSNFAACIMAQVAIYHKYVPIIIDNNQQNLDKLRRYGVYFAFMQDENLETNVADATGGNMCDAAIFTPCSRLNPNLAAKVLAHNKTLVLGTFSPIDFKLDAMPILERNLHILGISNGYGYTETAINMITHGALDLSMFESQTFTDCDPAQLYAKQLEDVPHCNKMSVIKLIL
ncbi:MAG: alcohol dehydrogenase catalytic domain-containing protein [Candidatus Coproplasma sp.]